jgi:hypothetical protein
MIVDMDLEDNFIQEMQNLCIASHHAMEKLKSRKKGFDIIDKWECAFCHGTIDRQSSQNVCRVSYWVLEDREKTFLDCLRLHIRTFSKNQTQALSSIFQADGEHDQGTSQFLRKTPHAPFLVSLLPLCHFAGQPWTSSPSLCCFLALCHFARQPWTLGFFALDLLIPSFMLVRGEALGLFALALVSSLCHFAGKPWAYSSSFC